MVVATRTGVATTASHALNSIYQRNIVSRFYRRLQDDDFLAGVVPHFSSGNTSNSYLSRVFPSL